MTGTQTAADPLASVQADHESHRAICRDLLALTACDTLDPAALAHFLRCDLPRHWADEEEDIFPWLRRRADPEDGIETVLERLLADHTAARARVAMLAEALDQRTPDTPLGPSLAESCRDFARAELRHLMFENAVVVPLARARLTPEDRETLRRHLDARRTANA